MIITAIAITMFETAVLHPALKFTAERENGPIIYINLVKEICNLNQKLEDIEKKKGIMVILHTSGKVARSA